MHGPLIKGAFILLSLQLIAITDICNSGLRSIAASSIVELKEQGIR